MALEILGMGLNSGFLVEIAGIGATLFYIARLLRADRAARSYQGDESSKIEYFAVKYQKPNYQGSDFQGRDFQGASRAS
jgi:hypothetical protein